MESLDIRFTDVGDDWLIASMPVCNKTFQQYKVLHGGASLALAETVGGAASSLLIDLDNYYANGLEINANHVKPVNKGYVNAKASIIHKGELTHIWDIKIKDDENNLICVCRLTNVILKKGA